MANLVWWELVRLARRGHTVRVRILLLYALLLAVVVFAFAKFSNPVPFFLGTETLPRAQIAGFARWLVFALLEAQLLFVALVTPAYAVAAIAEEKDRGTLPLLLTTALTDREIVWSKAIARVLLVLAAVIAGLPVLMFTLLLGGVDVKLLLAGYALAIGTTILSGGIGIVVACLTPDSRTALIYAYIASAVLVGGVVPPCMFLSPFAALYFLLETESRASQMALGIAYPLGQAFLACVLVQVAGRGLRKAGVTSGPLSPTAYPESPRGRPDPVLVEAPEILPSGMGELGTGDPVLWKERHAKAHSVRWVAMLTAVAALIAMALFVRGGWTLVKRVMQALDPDEATRFLQPGLGSHDLAGVLLMFSGLIASWLYLLPLAVGVTGCIAGERLQSTLDSLLATQLDRGQILWAKIRTHAEHGLVFAGSAAAALGAGFGAEGGIPLGLAIMAAFAGGIVLVVGLGAWFSVRCTTGISAFRYCLPATVGVGCLPMVAWYFTNWENPAATVEVLAGCAGMFLMVGVVMAWRARADLEHGD